ncbi:phytoene/squalene synthase family protein, partial [Paraburkholderia aspalathi]|nr:phytoene/squalene synthase family protein [Paraburkholderia aspalathi]
AVGVSHEVLLSGQDREALDRVVAAMAALAQEHLGEFNRIKAEIPRSIALAFLPLAPVGAYLKAISRLQGRAAEQVAEITPLYRQWLFLRAGLGRA